MRTYVEPSTRLLESDNCSSRSTLDVNTGEIQTTHRIYDDRINYMLYLSEKGMLVVETSIPKFLFGNNVQMVTEDDLENWWIALGEHLAQHYDLRIDADSWKVTRLDVCRNFHVGHLAQEYVKRLGQRKLPRHNTIVYNHSQTVVYENQSSRLMVYDKYQECINHNEPPQVCESAKGVLRFEITPTKDEMTAFSRKRNAKDFLTSKFYTYMMNKDKVRNLLTFPLDGLETMDFEWVKTRRIQDIERYIGYRILVEKYGETSVKLLYGSPTTFLERKRLERELQPPIHNTLDALC